GVAEVHADAVDEHALTDGERWLHRSARDPVGLDDEGLDADREPERDGDYQRKLDDRAQCRFGGSPFPQPGDHAGWSPAAASPSGSPDSVEGSDASSDGSSA